MIPADHVARWVQEALAPLGWAIVRPEGEGRRERYHTYYLSAKDGGLAGPFDSPAEAVEWARADG